MFVDSSTSVLPEDPVLFHRVLVLANNIISRITDPGIGDIPRLQALNIITWQGSFLFPA